MFESNEEIEITFNNAYYDQKLKIEVTIMSKDEARFIDSAEEEFNFLESALKGGSIISGTKFIDETIIKIYIKEMDNGCSTELHNIYQLEMKFKVEISIDYY
jgi:hypothetical protein